MKQNRNSIMRGASGALGKELVFRQRAGNTVISLPPVPRVDNPTTDQIDVRTKFREGIRYAKAACADPATKVAYTAKARGGRSAFNVAMVDFFKAPEIIEVEITTYTGLPGEPIVIVATDDFKVKTVQVSILNNAGNEIESGMALAHPESEDFWTYTTTAVNPDGPSGYVKVQVSDLPGNVTTRELSL
ncbi:hypothetical protein GFS24_09440 [Chitinophaga sp. SYP-B3965]|uniref:hypothetical protein n=1 Tax=Chitinophaga sp. SYP-B3965 TaxID=2663120 RepID=UPI0012995CFB|nr:hypothetical protein [Chitinophaga sp. SYP-B3965]MRG45339.1 hypothetical protein [Chitinophaga sp. SYP-B3965]